MKTGQRLFLITLMTLLLASVSLAQEKGTAAALPAPATVQQAKMPITLQSGEYELISIIFDFAPGAGVPLHRHGGQVLVQVLSGEITVREKGIERVMKAGDSWTESPGNEHAAINAGSVTARVAVSMLLPKGAEATTIIKR
ncbi:MAG TPA: cupin domain-containing protein [Geobacteraceae bacterium]